MDIITLLQVMIGFIIFLMVILVLIYIWLVKPKKVKKEEPTMFYTETQYEKEDKKIQNYGRFQGELTQESIFDFMEFDEIVDNMIVRKNKTQYVMVLQCNGVNYDLMSEDEKISVEEGFVQFLNTLRFPIQLYIQSRTLNLNEIIEEYRGRITAVQNDLQKLEIKLIQAKKANNRAMIEKLDFEKRRKENVLGYGVEMTEYVERLNSNQSILQQKTYVIVSFFVSELGGGLENYTKEEIDNMCFSELYTRCQNVASSLSSSQVTSRILDSEELAELLYIAYNRDESEIYNLARALDAQYDALYSTGKDVLEKKQEKLDQEINIAAIDLATDSILRADKQKHKEDLEKEKYKLERIKDAASDILGQYEEQLDPRVYELAKENISKNGEEDVKKEEPEKKAEVKKVVKKTVPAKTEKKVVSKNTTTSSNEVPKRKVVKKPKED